MINRSATDHHSLPGRLLRLSAHLLPTRMVMRIRRGPARGLICIAWSSTHRCWLGTYELDKQAALQRFVRPGMTIYEISAQAGF